MCPGLVPQETHYILGKPRFVLNFYLSITGLLNVSLDHMFLYDVRNLATVTLSSAFLPIPVHIVSLLVGYWLKMRH